MSARFKYLFSPFHVFSLWLIYEMVREYQMNPGPMSFLFSVAMLGLILLTLTLDVVIQVVNFRVLKGDWKILWLVQTLIVVVTAFFMIDTIHYPK